MAEFTGVDKALPWLTQAYQIDTSNRAEVERFVLRSGLMGEDAGHVAALLDLTRDIMDTLFEHERLSPESATACADIFNRVESWHGHYLVFPDDDGMVNPVRLLQPIRERQHSDAESTFWRYAKNLMEAVNRGASPLRRCEVGGEIFISSRKTQRFCSHRCANRLAQRNRRSRVKNNV